MNLEIGTIVKHKATEQKMIVIRQGCDDHDDSITLYECRYQLTNGEYSERFFRPEELSEWI